MTNDLRIADAPLLVDVSGEEKLPTGGYGNYSTTINQIADFTQLKWKLATEGYVNNEISVVTNKLNTHAQDKTNPHGVTKEQVGLGEVDNTADLDKPVSAYQRTAIDEKVAKTSIVDNLTNNESTKVLSAKQGKVLQDNKAEKKDVYTKEEVYAKDEVYSKDETLTLEREDKYVLLSNGRTQRDKNDELLSVLDFKATAYDLTDVSYNTSDSLNSSDTAFDEFEEVVSNQPVNLKGKCYKVSFMRNGNRYYNGAFIIDGLIQNLDFVSLYSTKWSRDCGEGFVYDEIALDEPYTGGYIQSVSYDIREHCYWVLSNVQDQTDTSKEYGIIHRHINESRKTCFRTMRTVNSAIVGHQGMGSQRVDGVTKLWIGFNKAYSLNSHYVGRITVPENDKDVDTSTLESFKVFDAKDGNLNKEYHCSPTVSPNGDLLVVGQIDYTQHQNIIKIFDLRSMTDTSVDYTDKYLFKFYATHYHNGELLPLQSVVTDGQFVYALFGETLYTYTMGGQLVDQEALKVGYNRSRGFTGANGHAVTIQYYEPESLLFVPTNDGLTLGVSVVMGYRNAWATTQSRYNYIYTSIPRTRHRNVQLDNSKLATINSTASVDFSVPYTKGFNLSIQGESYAEGTYDNLLGVNVGELILYNKDLTASTANPSGVVLTTQFTGGRQYAQFSSARGGVSKGAMITTYGNSDTTLAKGTLLLSAGVLNDGQEYTMSLQPTGDVLFKANMRLGSGGTPLEQTYTKAIYFNATVFLTWMVGSPEGVLIGGVGSKVINLSNGDEYIKKSGTGNTGWVLK